MAKSGRHWIGTIPFDRWTKPDTLPCDVLYIRGQQEIGNGNSAYHHWQVLVSYGRTVRLSHVTKQFPGHWELTRSKAADAYVFKSETAVPETQFELGTKPLKRNSAADWKTIRLSAQAGKFEDIPDDIFIRCYHQIKSINSDSAVAVAMERICYVFWGKTGTGKTRRAWEEAGMDAYPKCSRTKWWDGYRNQTSVIIDEFRGAIDVTYLLLWLDRYPVNVEIKGGRMPLSATKVWITSNLHPREWFPDLDPATWDALSRRLVITEILGPL